MLPGEEWRVERLFRVTRELVSKLLSSSANTGRRLQSNLMPPAGDGSVAWANPQVVSAVLLGAITLLLFVRFGGPSKVSPRRIVRRLRRRAPSRHVVKRQLLFNRPPIFRERHARGLRRPSSDFVSARDLLDARLERMVGLGGIKSHLRALLDTLEMDQRRCASMPGYVSRRGCMHCVFLGNPGTGKTAMAELVACVLCEMGVLRRGHLVVAKKADLLGRYSNHVSRNTRAIIESALGGVLLLDEAYALLQGEADLGREVLNVLVDLCYAHRDDLVVILAGYTDTMADLFEANPGLASRFPHKFAFPDYAADELYLIARHMLRDANFTVADDAAAAALAAMVSPVVLEAPCGNARSVENRIAAAITAQSTRLKSGAHGAPLDETNLFALTAADFRAACDGADRSTAVLALAAQHGHEQQGQLELELQQQRQPTRRLSPVSEDRDRAFGAHSEVVSEDECAPSPALLSPGSSITSPSG